MDLQIETEEQGDLSQPTLPISDHWTPGSAIFSPYYALSSSALSRSDCLITALPTVKC